MMSNQNCDYCGSAEHTTEFCTEIPKGMELHKVSFGEFLLMMKVGGGELVVMGGDQPLRCFERTCKRSGSKLRMEITECYDVLKATMPDFDPEIHGRALMLGRKVESKKASYLYFPERVIPTLKADTEEAAIKWLEEMVKKELTFDFDTKAEDVFVDGDPLFTDGDAPMANACMREAVLLIGLDKFDAVKKEKKNVNG